jgi:HAD superfamily hydrolase (TIGR01509 family)
MSIDALLFDLEGTLVDSSQTHLVAWLDAIHGCGYEVEPRRVAEEIDKGGDQLIPALLGDAVEIVDGDALRAWHDQRYTELAEQAGLQVAPGAEELLNTLHARGIRTVLATSTGDEQLEVAERCTGVRWRAFFDERVSANDVDNTSPAPDLVRAAAERLGVEPSHCVMVGDTEWDLDAAADAGVPAIAFTFGGRDAESLYRAGATAVCRDPAELLSRLDEVLDRLGAPQDR